MTRPDNKARHDEALSRQDKKAKQDLGQGRVKPDKTILKANQG